MHLRAEEYRREIAIDDVLVRRGDGERHHRRRRVVKSRGGDLGECDAVGGAVDRGRRIIQRHRAVHHAVAGYRHVRVIVKRVLQRQLGRQDVRPRRAAVGGAHHARLRCRVHHGLRRVRNIDREVHHKIERLVVIHHVGVERCGEHAPRHAVVGGFINAVALRILAGVDRFAGAAVPRVRVTRAGILRDAGDVRGGTERCNERPRRTRVRRAPHPPGNVAGKDDVRVGDVHRDGARASAHFVRTALHPIGLRQHRCRPRGCIHRRTRWRARRRTRRRPRGQMRGVAQFPVPHVRRNGARGGVAGTQ